MQQIVREIYDSLERNGSNIAFRVDGIIFTYSEFGQLVSSIAQKIQSVVVPQQQVIAVYATNSIETYASILAVWFTGNIYFPLNPKYPSTRILNSLDESNSVAILSNGDLPEWLLNSNILQMRTDFELISVNKPYTFVEGSILYLLQTSGSTGTPKLVPISSSNLAAYAEGYLHVYPETNAADCFLQTYEFTSDAFFSGFIIPLLCGASIATLSNQLVKPMALLRGLTQNPVTWVKMTPSLLSLLSNYLKQLNLPRIRYAQFGGEQLQSEFIEKWRNAAPNSIIGNSYGPTETTVTSSIYSIEPQSEVRHQSPISIGNPFKHVIYRVIHSDGRFCQAHEPGELLIGGLQTMHGYKNRNNDDVFSFIDGQPFYKSGDQVYFDESGLFYFVGRVDFQIKCNGYRIEPGEIESVITKVTHSRSKIILVDGQLIAFVEAETMQNENILKIREELPPHMIPSKWIAIPVFPINIAGKIDREMLIMKYEKL